MSQDTTAVNDNAATATATTESATAENNLADAEHDDLMEASLDELEAEAGEQAEDTKEQSEDTEQAETAEGEKPLSPKSENRFQKLANENREYRQNLQDPNFLRQQLSQLTVRQQQVATEQDLMNQINPETGDYFTPQEAERIARQQANEQLQQTLQAETYQIQVQQSQQAVQSEAMQTLADFPIFDEQSPEYRPEIAQQYEALLGQSIMRDANGAITGMSLSPYQLAKTIADSIGIGAVQGQAKAQQATQQMVDNADQAPNGSSAGKKKSDPMLDAFDEEAGL